MLEASQNTEQESMEQRLQELAEKGIGCKASETPKRGPKRRVNNDPTVQVGNIIYRFYSDAHSIMDALRSNDEKFGIDVLAFGHNCIGKQQGILKFLAPRIPGLLEADKGTGRAFTKLGTFCGVKYVAKSGKESFVTPMYVQYSLGIPPKENQETYKPAFQGKYHINPSNVFHSMNAVINTFRERKIGVVMFGNDRFFPTPWEMLEGPINDACVRSNVTVTVFIPTYILTQDRQALSPKLKEAARSVGFAFV